MRPFKPFEIRARTRPAAVLLVYGVEVVSALVVATPAHAWAQRAWGAHPEGDALLFRASGRELVAWVSQTDTGMSVTARTTIVLFFLGALLMQLPLGALLASLAFSNDPPADRDVEGASGRRRQLRLVDALRAGVVTFVPLIGVLAFGTLAVGIVVAIGVATSSAIGHAFTPRFGDARAFQLTLFVLVFFVAAAATLAVAADLIRVAIARECGMAWGAHARIGVWTVMRTATKSAFRTLRGSVARTVFAWSWRFALGVGLVGVGASAALALGGRGGGALVALVVIHQVVILGRVALRASWLADATRQVARATDQSEIQE